MAAFINARLIYFLKLKEEEQLLNGLGSGGDLNGLLTQATPYSGSGAANALDQVRLAIAQVAVAGFSANAVALHPNDWAAIELLKTSGSGEYIATGNPRSAGAPSLWGVNVVPTMAMDEGDFLVADLANCAELFDRMQSSVEISREHASMFVENMCAILAEERLALVVYQPSGIVSGTLIGVSP